VTAPAAAAAPSYRSGDLVYWVPPVELTDDHYAGIPAVVLETRHGELYDLVLFPPFDDRWVMGQTVTAAASEIIPGREDSL
jgi:hypothetical protein